MFKLAKYHIWLGWLIGVPLLLWTASGLFMVAQPIETIRGNHLKTAPLSITPIATTAPLLEGRPVLKLSLEQRASGPVWIIQYQDGGFNRADPTTGKILPAVAAPEARALAEGYFAGDAKIVSVARTDADNPPMDLRRNRPAWQVSYDDDTNLYIDADTGAALATRTTMWRIFDFMWGLHIMDLQTREDTSHPILIFFSALAFFSTIVGIILLFRRRKAKIRNKELRT